ncbi:MAG TPA: SRPBCC family protein [Acidimicrobiales bacterium]|nr:SRPBCC family protein [Acidimicrobiales bacterium]
MEGDVLSVERVVAAPPAAVFALLADCGRHHEIDGSGTVQGTKAGPSGELGLGSTFGMRMRLGLPYTTSNTVIEFEPDRRIAWQTGVGGFASRFAGGRIWRYELEPAEGGTLVRESWDLSQDKMRGFLRRVAAATTKKNMEKTLERIEELTRA